LLFFLSAPNFFAPSVSEVVTGVLDPGVLDPGVLDPGVLDPGGECSSDDDGTACGDIP